MNFNELPTFLYGTAWKEEQTSVCTQLALEKGFRGIDTANQRKHYFEMGVGLGIQNFLKQSSITREALFIQTKFTYISGQDNRLPYAPSASFKQQVNQSFESSLSHLNTDYIDSFVLHGPAHPIGLTDDDWEVWNAMSELLKQGKVRYLGVSNISLQQLQQLYDEAEIKPQFVQNRCFAIRQWDKDIRQFCHNNEIIYQGFSLLTANQPYLHFEEIITLANQYQKTIPQIIFRFAQQVGMLPLTGTTNQLHMQHDLSIDDFSLSERHLEIIENIAQ